MTNQPERISAAEILEVVQMASRGGKPVRYTTLGKYKESICDLMGHDAPLTAIKTWLDKKHGEKLALNTLRKFVIREIGQETYAEYLYRNGWQKSKRDSVQTPVAMSATHAVSHDQKNKLAFDLPKTKPATFIRSTR